MNGGFLNRKRRQEELGHCKGHAIQGLVGAGPAGNCGKQNI